MVAVDAKFAGGNDEAVPLWTRRTFDGRTAIGKRRHAGRRYQQAGNTHE